MQKEPDYNKLTKEELIGIIQKKNEEIKWLKGQLAQLEIEKDEMVESFQTSTHLLIEKLKDMYAGESDMQGENGEQRNNGQAEQTGNGEKKPQSYASLQRPQTAQIINKLRANPPRVRQLRSPLLKKGNIPEDAEGEEEVKTSEIQCTNCKKKFPASEIDTHVILCYRNNTTCKICKEAIPKDSKAEHLKEWRSISKVINAIEMNYRDIVERCVDHGVNVDTVVPERGNASNSLYFINLFQAYLRSSAHRGYSELE
eukprot:TRINITY_DN4416_c0_g1_i3.p1 TRINITY_DN4416_c0_g1~~TRINITY_DN4416_c0_g1_i3.p1  ORF type:complete len:256 (+),score=60.76 TRINITY_DN4416_c0_g1_i3:107-874(+)